jgi:hypothetical protein
MSRSRVAGHHHHARRRQALPRYAAEGPDGAREDCVASIAIAPAGAHKAAPRDARRRIRRGLCVRRTPDTRPDAAAGAVRRRIARHAEPASRFSPMHQESPDAPRIITLSRFGKTTPRGGRARSRSPRWRRSWWHKSRTHRPRRRSRWRTPWNSPRGSTVGKLPGDASR